MPDTDADSTQHHNARLKMPTFSGSATENIHHWITIFEKWCILSQYNDAQKPSLLSFVFTGSAAKILSAWELSGSVPNSWADTKTKLITQFSDASRTKIYEATLLRRKWQSSVESFEDYFADVLSLCSLVNKNMSEANKIQNLLKGLPENICQFLLFKDPDNTDDVLKGYASYKTAKLLTAPLTENSEPTATAAPAILENVTSALTSKFESLMISQNEKISELQALVLKTEQKLNEPKCFRCGKTGHMAKDCALPRSPNFKRREYENRDRQVHRPSHRNSSPHHSRRERTPSPYSSGHYRSSSPYQHRYSEKDSSSSQNRYPDSRRSSSPYYSDRYQSRSDYHRRSPSPGRYYSNSRSEN
jgi:hypothetical protein